jgi:hypothetical protein
VFLVGGAPAAVVELELLAGGVFVPELLEVGLVGTEFLVGGVAPEVGPPASVGESPLAG